MCGRLRAAETSFVHFPDDIYVDFCIHGARYSPESLTKPTADYSNCMKRRMWNRPSQLVCSHVERESECITSIFHISAVGISFFVVCKLFGVLHNSTLRHRATVGLRWVSQFCYQKTTRGPKSAALLNNSTFLSVNTWNSYHRLFMISSCLTSWARTLLFPVALLHHPALFLSLLTPLTEEQEEAAGCIRDTWKRAS